MPIDLIFCIALYNCFSAMLFTHSIPFFSSHHSFLYTHTHSKRFIIGRQFCTVLTGFLLAQIFTLANFENTGYDPIGFYIIVKSGLVGVLIVLAFGQLMPELIAAEFPLRFMNMYGSYTVGYISLFFDAVGVGHAGWSFYYLTRPFFCKDHMGQLSAAKIDTKPEILRVHSAELLAATGKTQGNYVPQDKLKKQAVDAATHA